MAITAFDWLSATDPFIFATSHATGAVVGDLTNWKIDVADSYGFLSGITDNKDVQEAFWSEDADKTNTWAVEAMKTNGVGPNAGPFEMELWNQYDGTNYNQWRAEDYFEPDPKTLWIWVGGRSNGPKTYSLFVYTAYAWADKDPAQIIFSWVAHHTPSNFALKDFIDSSNFISVSAYYDENPARLYLWREVGMSIAKQIKKVMDHTSDALVIRPSDTDGALTLHIMPRQMGLSIRTTSIDIDSKSIKDFLFRPTDRYRIDRLDASYGAVFGERNTAYPSSSADYDHSSPLDIPGIGRSRLRQQSGPASPATSVSVDLPYHIRRGNIANHIPIEFWRSDQSEIELSFSDWSHLNFEAGDIVPLTGVSAGIDSANFMCVEKTVDIDTMLASARFIEVLAVEGKSPRYADTTNLLCSITPVSLGDYFEESAVFPRLGYLAEDPPNIDRLWDMSDNYAHVLELTRGAPPAGNLNILDNVANGWPVLTNDGTMGGDFPYSGFNQGVHSPLGAVSNYTFYIVIDPSDTATTRAIFAQGPTDPISVFSSVSGLVRFYDGSYHGTKPATTGLQILTFVLDSAGSSIRRNGVDLETGLAYTQQKLSPGSNNQSFLCNVSGDAHKFLGDFAEMHIFSAAHNSTTVSDIEAHLAEKYGISI